MGSKERWGGCLLWVTRLEECYMDDWYLILVPRDREEGERGRREREGGGREMEERERGGMGVERGREEEKKKNPNHRNLHPPRKAHKVCTHWDW